MPDRRRLLDVLPLLLALWVVATLVGIWAGRLTHPFDLEWMEGGMLAHAWRVANGLPIYAAPDPSFIPFVYPPGYSVAVAAVSLVTGLDYAPARALSLLGALGAAAALLAALLRDGSRDVTVAVATTAAFLGCYPSSGAFYDLVRPDGLSLGFLAWAIVTALWRRPVWAGVLLAAAFWCKHSAALFGVPLVLAFWARDGLRPALRFALASVGPALGATVIQQAVSGGHFLRYLLLVPASHPMVGARVWPLTPSELGIALPVLAPVAVFAGVFRRPQRVPVSVAVGVPVVLAAVSAWLALAWNVRSTSAVAGHVAIGLAAGVLTVHAVDFAWSRTRPSGDWVLATGLGLTALAGAMLMRGHQGGYVNVHMPAHWVLCLGGGMALARWRSLDPRLPVAALTAAVLALQLAVHRAELDHDALVPSTADRLAGESIVAELALRPGPVLSPYAAWLPVAAGHPPSLHQIGLLDIDHEDGPYAADVARIEAAIQARRYGTVVDGTRPIGHGVDAAYRQERIVLPPNGAMRPRTGWDVQPRRLLVPR